MCTGSEAFRASPAPGLSRPVNSSLGRACLAELALPPSRLQPRDVSLLDLNFAGGGWENASGGWKLAWTALPPTSSVSAAAGGSSVFAWG